MRLTLCFVCLSVALQYTFAQNTDSQFNFGLFGNNGGAGGAPAPTGSAGQTPGLVSANPTALGAPGGGMQQNGLQNTGLTQNQGMTGQGGLGQNSMMNGQNGMMNPNGMAMPGQNGMQNGMMQNGMQNGMMQNGMSQNGMQNGMMQNGMQNGMQNNMMGNGMQNGMMQGNNMMQNGMMQNGMQQNGMMQNGMMQNGMMQNGMQQNGMMNSFQDPTRMGRFNGNNLNQLGFDPNSQANLFQNQLTPQNMPRFGMQQTQFGQGQFGQPMSPFGQQMPFTTPFGAQFGSTFTSQPGFGMFPDPMMNAFAPNPFQMSAAPMMGPGPMGMFMPGMEMSNLIFDASGNVVGSTGSAGGVMQAGGLTQGGLGLTQTSGNSFVFPQPTQTMLPVANGLGLPGGFGSTTISANPAIMGMGQFAQNQGFTQGGLTPQNAGQMQGMQNSFGNSALRPQFGNGNFASNTLQGQMMPSNMQSINSNTNALGTMNAAQQSSSNSFALNNNGMPINTKIEPFSGIVPNQGGTVLKDPSGLNNPRNSAAPVPIVSGTNAASMNSVNSNPAFTNMPNTNSGVSNTGFGNAPSSNTGNFNNGPRNMLNSNSADTNGFPNTLNSNTANVNNGFSNMLNSNTANVNNGFSNTLDSNTANVNNGFTNTLNSNSANVNNGFTNTLDSNSANFNSGFTNTLNSNTASSNIAGSNTQSPNINSMFSG